MKKGLRHQLVPRTLSSGDFTRETKVIVVDAETYQIPDEVITSLVNISTWDERYSISAKHSPGHKDQYVKLLKRLWTEIGCEDGLTLKAKIIKYSREIMGSSHEQLFSRYVRRRMVGRLMSLLIEFDPIREILSDQKVLGITISGRNYLRVHKDSESMETLNWFVAEEEAKILKYVLSSLLKEGKVSLKLSDSLEANISGLKVHDVQDSSIVVTPKRSRKHSMLDLIRAKVLSPQLARNISMSMLNTGKGFLVSGGLSSGKSGLLSALISSVPTNSVPLIIADNEELKGCHPHAEVLTHAELLALLSHSTYRYLENSIFRMGAKYLFVDDLNPSLYLFLLRMKLVYDIPIVATIPGINPKHYLRYLLEDVRNLKGMDNQVDDVEIAHLVDAFPYVVSLSKENDLKGVSCIYETASAGQNFHLVPIIRRQFDNPGISWRPTEVASADSLITIGFRID